MQLIITILSAVIIFSILPSSSQASELSEWLRAATYVYIAHEGGHQDRATAKGVSYEWTYAGGGFGFVPDWRIGYKPMPKMSSKVESEYQILKFVSLHKIASTPQIEEMRSDLNEFIQKQNNAIADGLRTQASIAGGGYAAQQKAVEELPDGEFKRKAIILSATLKGLYVPWSFAQPNTGDISRLLPTAPFSLISSALIVSSITDYFRASQDKLPDWHVDFLSEPHSGAVGLAFSGRF